MRKSMKLVFLILLVVLILVGLFLIFKDKVLLNGENKVSDLVCVRTYPETEDREIITIKFDEEGISKEYIETQVMYFSSNEEAKAIYEDTGEDLSESMDGQLNLFYDSKMELDNNTIKSSFYFKIEKGQEMYNKTKEELSIYYETEYRYECED